MTREADEAGLLIRMVKHTVGSNPTTGTNYKGMFGDFYSITSKSLLVASMVELVDTGV